MKIYEKPKVCVVSDLIIASLAGTVGEPIGVPAFPQDPGCSGFVCHPPNGNNDNATFHITWKDSDGTNDLSYNVNIKIDGIAFDGLTDGSPANCVISNPSTGNYEMICTAMIVDPVVDCSGVNSLEVISITDPQGHVLNVSPSLTCPQGFGPIINP